MHLGYPLALVNLCKSFQSLPFWSFFSVLTGISTPKFPLVKQLQIATLDAISCYCNTSHCISIISVPNLIRGYIFSSLPQIIKYHVLQEHMFHTAADTLIRSCLSQFDQC
jgi:hypothetical protein